MNVILRDFGRRLRLGVVGGSHGFIGPVHRTAARMDDAFEIVAGVLSSNPERGRAAAAAMGLPAERAYPDVAAMVEAEQARGDGIDVVAIMTPNADHYRSAMAALGAGLDVVCDKPLTTTLADALSLVAEVDRTGLVFVTTYNYSAYPMVRQAREMVRAGELGEIHQIHLTYVQGHNATLVEGTGDGRTWRFDPAQCGPSLILGDIGTHAHHLGAHVSGHELTAVLADLGAVVPGRQADDYAGVLLRWSNGARGTMWVTNAAAGGEHGLAFRIFGDKGGLEWHQEQPNELLHRRLGGFEERLTRRLHGALHPLAERSARVEIGHPEGYQEAFANLYLEAAQAVVARRTGRPLDPAVPRPPDVRDGARGIRFIEACIESARSGGWADARLEG
ncbi:MAG TPA: Gfo/Idh/MocA family oxidoreductase [Geminicoccaceae bacterium]|nr:Gfo/Idh/MocA family oxidoreductase [Geminicoccus sp.]HMU52765.1 Gfo/Idh/MocA family oxidoreductase [Geminicoccaceae bacterium]